MVGRAVLAGCLAALLIAPGSLGQAATQKPAAFPRVLVPAAGNLTVARLTLKAATLAGAPRTPRLTLAGTGRLEAGAFVGATVARVGASTRFLATVAIIRPAPQQLSAPAAQPASFLTLTVPAGFTLVGTPQIAANALYMNTLPRFRLVTRGTGSVLAGGDTIKLPTAQIVKDAQLLALDRSVPLADMGLLGLPYVSVEFAKAGTTIVHATIGVTHLTPVNAVELRFPAGVTLSRAVGPTGTDGLLLGSAAQLIDSSGFFQEGVEYTFTLDLSRPPAKGDFVRVRASTHYFEGSLPFVERFALI